MRKVVGLIGPCSIASMLAVIKVLIKKLKNSKTYPCFNEDFVCIAASDVEIRESYKNVTCFAVIPMD